MFRIAICDGNPESMESIRSLLDTYKECSNSIDMALFCFDSGERLLETLDSGQAYDLYILEVHMPGLTGIEIAKRIRGIDAEVPLVFIACSEDYAFDAFRVSATQYFLKPVSESDLTPILDKIFSSGNRKADDSFLFPASDRTVKLSFSEIEHIEINDHKMIAHLVGGNEIISRTIRTSFIKAIEPLLLDDRFFQVHRSYVINKEHVREMSGNSFLMESGSTIPVPSYKAVEAKANYYEWLTRQGISIPVAQKGKAGKVVKGSLTVPMIVVLILTAVLNLSPQLSAAAYEIPIIGDIVRVLTFNRFEFKDDGYTTNIIVPEIQGLLSPELQERLNSEFLEYADELIAIFERDYAELKEEFGDETVHMSIKTDYTVKTDTDRVISLDTYVYSDVVGFVSHRFYTIDKKTGTQVALSDLFKPDSDYIATVSEYIVREMTRINDEENGMFEVGDSMFAVFTEIRPDQNFFISETNELVICFDKYEVAAAPQGSPEFIIPTNIIADILSTDMIG